VLFLSAEEPDILQRNLASLTSVLPSLKELNAAPDDQRIDAVLNWLQTHPGWLLILDNVDDEDAVTAVKQLLPRLACGHTLITSRFSRWGASVNTLDLDVLNENDAVAYLLEATDGERVHTEQDTESAAQVAQKVGHHALGLEHAAAFVKARFLSFDDYLTLWNQNEAQILEAVDLDEIEYPHELLVTWQLSVDQLTEEARDLLSVLSWLSPEPIPEALFKTFSEDGQPTVNTSVANLCKYSLANRTQENDQRGVQIHRLVQSTTRYHQFRRSDNKLPALTNALNWINDAYQGKAADVRDWPQLEPLAEHVADTALLKHRADYAEAELITGAACKDWPTDVMCKGLLETKSVSVNQL